MINAFISGAIALGCLVIGLFFCNFWKQTQDRLFGIFALSFWMLAIERAIPIIVESEHTVLQYVVRLVAFILILIAIIDKNFSNNTK